MLIPSIDLMGGRIVQLVQGETLALESRDLDGWIARFSDYPKVQVVDLDAARGTGDNRALVRAICGRLACRVGGGIRTAARAKEALDAGAHAVIVSSALFRSPADAGSAPIDAEFARRLSKAVGPERLIAGIDSRGGRVVIHGWRTPLPLSPVDAVRALEAWCGEFLYTHVDTEGLMRGTDMEAILAIRRATTRRVTAAGGIATQAEIDRLDAEGVDAVVGMAIYTGRLAPAARPRGRRD